MELINWVPLITFKIMNISSDTDSLQLEKNFPIDANVTVLIANGV